MKPRGPILNQPVVLLVEDEPLVRATQVDVLRDAGFWVLEAQDADEAFEILKRRAGVGVVLTDVDMPGSLDGFEFSRADELLESCGMPANDVEVLVVVAAAIVSAACGNWSCSRPSPEQIGQAQAPPCVRN